MTDVSEATFQQEVLDRSNSTTVVVDLWAEWCGPCKTLGPLLEAAIGARDNVVLVKVDVDANPQLAQAFQAQSIPAVHAIRDGQVVGSFVGAQPADYIEKWLDEVAPGAGPAEVVDPLDAVTDEAGLRIVVANEPANAAAIVKLATVLLDNAKPDEALEFLARIPETSDVRQLAARARAGGVVPDDGTITAELTTLLDSVKDDEDARQRYVDLLDLLGPDHPRTVEFRRALSTRLF